MECCRRCSLPLFTTALSALRVPLPFLSSTRTLCRLPTFFSSKHLHRFPIFHHPFTTSTLQTPTNTLQTPSQNTSPLTKPNPDVHAYLKAEQYRKAYNLLLQHHENSTADVDLYRQCIRGFIRGGRAKYALDAWGLREERNVEFGGCDVGLGAGVVRACMAVRGKDGVKRKDGGGKKKGIGEEVRILVERLIDECEVIGEKRDKGFVGNAVMGLGGVVVVLLKKEEGGLAGRVLKVVFDLGVKYGVFVSVGVGNEMIRLLGKIKRLGDVFLVVDGMKMAGVELNDETFEFLANAVVKQVEFVTSAVSMGTLPEPMCPEVAFVGRSNVGKSSLLNMLCNRKTLAYTSQRPGKTQQFNYFLVNSKSTDSKFYLVDLPGVGYAKVPGYVQAEWLEFMVQYLEGRKNLAVVLHLIDGRHGIKVDDFDLMHLVGSGRCGAEYVVVLTKMDKLDKQKAKSSVVDEIRSAFVREGVPEETPIILSSSLTKLGRDELWRYLRMGLPTLQTPQAVADR